MQLDEKSTWPEIAEKLGCSRQALDTLRKLPGAPKSKNFEEWQKWIEDNGHLKGGSKKLTELKVLIAEEELKKKRRENSVAEGMVVPADEIRAFHQQWSMKLDQLLTHELDTNAPPLLLGCDIVELRKIMVEIHDRIRHATHAGLLNWRPE